MYSFGDFNILLILLIYNSNIKYTFLKKAKDPDFAARVCVCVCVCVSRLFRSFEFGNGSRMSDENLVILEFKFLQNKKW